LRKSALRFRGEISDFAAKFLLTEALRARYQRAMTSPLDDTDSRITRRRVAVLAGVDNYYYDGVPPLRYAEADCEKLRDALCHVQRYGFTSDDVRLLRGSESLPHNQPLRSMLLAGIWQELAGAKIDLLVLYLAMHGIEHDGRTYLVPQDGVVGHPETLVPLGAPLAEDGRRRRPAAPRHHRQLRGRPMVATFSRLVRLRDRRRTQPHRPQCM
jgi:hypothetical protein